jgi:hypothetical protein
MDFDDDALPGLLGGRESLSVERFHFGDARRGRDESESKGSKDEVTAMHAASFPAFRPLGHVRGDYHVGHPGVYHLSVNTELKFCLDSGRHPPPSPVGCRSPLSRRARGRTAQRHLGHQSEGQRRADVHEGRRGRAQTAQIGSLVGGEGHVTGAAPADRRQLEKRSDQTDVGVEYDLAGLDLGLDFTMRGAP